LGMEGVHRVGAGGEAVAGPELLGEGGAAGEWPALEHLDAQAGSGQVPRGHEAVVPCADDDDVGVDRAAGHASAFPPGLVSSALSAPSAATIVRAEGPCKTRH